MLWLPEMDRYDFARTKIQEKFNKKKWFDIEHKMRKQCKDVFLLWLQYVKSKTKDTLEETDAQKFVDEWVGSQKLESVYDKKYREEEDRYIIECSKCVFRVEDGDGFYCIRYLKSKSLKADCSNEPNAEGSEYFGELFEYLNLIKVYE